MKIFTNDDIRKIDRYTIDEEGISAHELVMRVAEGVTAEIVKRWRPTRPLTIFAGPGNNGADALAVARMLIEQGYDPEVYLFNIRGNSLSRECRTCRDELLATGRARLIEITDSMEHPELTERHLVVDGLFGSGAVTGIANAVAIAVIVFAAILMIINIIVGAVGLSRCKKNPQKYTFFLGWGIALLVIGLLSLGQLFSLRGVFSAASGIVGPLLFIIGGIQENKAANAEQSGSL